MEYMINSELIKKQRKERTWSQDHLASVSGLSLRTIQRIEKEGKCSLDSKKALASVFEIDASELDFVDYSIQIMSINKGRLYGFFGAGIGILCSYSAITFSVINGSMHLGEAGVYYGVIGAVTGITCGLIGYFSKQINLTST